jgi:tetratricopeptide (TPR) repeat protein
MRTIKPILKALVCGLVLTATAYPVTTLAAGPAEMDAVQAKLGILKDYFEIVNNFHTLASNPEKAVVLSLQQLEDNYKAQGKPEEIIKMYQNLLKEARSQTLRNVAYIKLSEIYKRSKRGDEAVALLKQALDENMKAVK